MDFSCSDEQTAIAELARQIFADKASPDRLTALEKGDGPRFDDGLWREVARAGLLGIAVPETYGGAQMGFLELALIIEQLGVAVAPIPYLETTVMGALPIAKFGSEEQKRALLPRVASGDLILTAALYEDGADPMKPETRVHRTAAGFEIRGTKTCVPAGDLAERILVPVRDEQDRVGLFLVDPNAAGCVVTSLETTSDQPEARIEMQGVSVSSDDQLGRFEDGEAILTFTNEHTNSALCSLALGVCEEALRLTGEYAKTREQFGQPIATFQAVGQRAADAFIDTEAVRLTSWQAAWRLSQGLPAAAQIATARVFASEAGHRVVHAATHIHGGMGVDKDYPLFRYFTYARQLGLTLGGPNAHLIQLGRMLASGTA